MKRVLYVSDLNETSPSDLMHLISVNSLQVRGSHKRNGVSAVQVFSNTHLLTLLEGDDHAVAAAIKQWRSQNHHKSMSAILQMDVKHRINHAPMRLIPLRSNAHTEFMHQLKISCSGSLNVQSDDDLSRWRDFADWGNLGSTGANFSDHYFFMHHWPETSDIVLDDDAMVLCAVLANKPISYESLLARNILPKVELDELLNTLNELDVLEATSV